MADADHLDYRLRCHTKRTDLPADVLRDIGEAYAEIMALQRKLADIKQGFEGCCTACEPVGLLNQQLRKERDEARRLYCIAFQEITENLGEKNTTESIAEEMGWDCYKEDTND